MQLTIDNKALRAWLRAALKECIQYGQHGKHTMKNADGTTVCVDCEQL